MPENAIEVLDVSKRFLVGTAAPYARMSELLMHMAGAPFRAMRTQRDEDSHSKTQKQSREFWALRNIRFNVEQGEVVGIIGRNGAGKSTMLKILSRITDPTSGKVRLRGRVSSLLEVGTGFHPELTGRENVFLNGAILGMTRGEVRQKMGAITSFAEIDKFLDTPVKHYSSGMYMRLAFAVAAHLEPDILIVDEVLAVGDAEFQQKCMGKMDDVARRGRTVIFVSHNMPAVENLCSRGIWLSQGEIKFDGSASSAVTEYLTGHAAGASIDLTDQAASSDSVLRFEHVSISGGDEPGTPIVAGGPAKVMLELAPGPNPSGGSVYLAVVVRGSYNEPITAFDTKLVDAELDIARSPSRVTCNVPSLPLAPGRYHLYCWLEVNSKKADCVERAVDFEVQPSNFFGSGRMPILQKHGPLMVHHDFSAESRTDA